MRVKSSDVQIPDSSVSVYEAIYHRRSVKEFIDESIDPEVMDRLFSVAVWAPNHRMTEPTRFFAIEKGSELRNKIGEIAWHDQYQKVANPNPEQKRRSADHSRDRVTNAPAMVYVYSMPGENEQMTLENYATACCAVHNIALAAVAEGLYMDWSTGGLSRLDGLAEMLGADEGWTMVGVLFIGRAIHVPEGRRTSHNEVVTWIK